MEKLSKDKGHWQAFNVNWFRNNQKKILSYVNGSWLKRKISRYALRIDTKEDLIEIGPHYYKIGLPNGQLQADFRMHDKYSKRIYYSLFVYWWLLHFLDWAFLDRFMPQYSFGFNELVVRSQDGEGGGGATVCDGYVARIVTAGVSLTSIRTGNGTSSESTITAGVGVRITCHADTNKYYAIRRAGFPFITSEIGAGSTVTNAVFSLYSTNTYHADTFDTVDSSLNIVSFAPAVCNPFEMTDYNSFGTTIYSTMSHADFVVSNGFKNFTLDAAGRTALINKTGISVLGMRVGSDISGTGITWKTSADVAIGVRWVDYTGTASDPYLTVTYTPGATTVYKPSAIFIN